MNRYISIFVMVFLCLCLSNNAFGGDNIKLVSPLEVESYFFNTYERGVFVYLSEQISSDQLKKHIRFQPSAGFFSIANIYKSDKNCYKISGNFKADQKYILEILPGNIENSDKHFSEAKIEFIGKGAEPKFEFIADRSVIELKSRQLIPVSFTNTENFRCELTNIPPFFAPALESLTVFAEADEKRPTDTDSTKANRDILKSSIINSIDIASLTIEMKKQYILLNNFDDPAKLPELELFVKEPFSVSSKGYLGSEGKETEMFFSLPLDYRKKPENGGSVLIKLSENKDSKAKDAIKLVQITDLSITYKFSAESLLIWVTSIETGKPVENAQIMLVTAENRYAFPGKTNNDGILTINSNMALKQLKLENEKYKAEVAPVPISSIIIASAVTENDSCFIKLNSNRIYATEVYQSAIDDASFSQKSGQVFCERGVYRPGEEVYWKAIFRKHQNNKITPPSIASAVVIIKNSENEEIYKQAHTLNDYGSCNGNLKLSKFTRLGQYQIEAYIPEAPVNERTGRKPEWDLLMNREPTPTKSEENKDAGVTTQEDELKAYSCKTFQVQEFEPPRHFVEINITSDKKKIKHIVGKEKEQDYIKCKITGKYYAGGSLKHAKVQWSAHLTGHKKRIAEYSDYSFGNDDSEKNLIESGNSILDKDGILELDLPLSHSVLSGLNNVEVMATILDVDGKAATVSKSYNADPPFKVGISSVFGPDTTGQSQLKTIALDKNGNKLGDGKITLEIMNNKWFYTQKRGDDGRVYYNWTNAWIRNIMLKENMKDGEALFDITLDQAESYMIKASYTDGIHTSVSARMVSLSGNLSGYVDYSQKNRVSSGNQLILAADKYEAHVDDKITVKFTLPRPCSYALVTCENNDILNARVIKIDKAHGEITETLSEKSQPNVYIGITAPTIRSSFPLYSGSIDTDYPRTCYGYAKIAVKKEQSSLNIQIEPSEKNLIKTLPGQIKKLQFFTHDSKKNPVKSELAVCVVDESILNLTGFATPIISILKSFVMPLSVFTGDLRVSLISQDLFKMISTRALTGGGEGDGNIVAETNLRKDFRPVAYWNPSLETNSQGMAEIEFKVPDTMTMYRIYAVGIDKGSGFDSKDRPMQVSKDFYVEPAVPAFLTFGDKAIVPLTIHNKTKQSGTVNSNIESMQNISAKLKTEKLELEEYTNKTAKIFIEADSDFKEGNLTVSGKFNGMFDFVKKTIPINSAHTIINRQKSGAFNSNTEINVEFPEWINRENLQNNVSARLTVSKGLWSRVAPTLKYLMTYPYGCSEQVSSGLMPLAALRALAETEKLPGYKAEHFDSFIEKGLEKLYKMQLGSGGFAYWPSSGNESWWSTQYAILSLSLLQKAGYIVDKDRLSKSLDYVNKTLFKEDDNSKFRHGILALACVNLAMNNKLTAADLDKLRKKFTNTDDEGKTLILWAEILMGNLPKDSIQSAISKIEPSQKSISKSWHSSSVRHDAFKLLICLSDDTKKSKEKATNIAGSLLQKLNRNGYWNSTADTGIALFALSEYLKREEKEDANNNTLKIVLTSINGEKEYEVSNVGFEIELTPEEITSAKGIKIEAADKSLINWSLNYSYPDDPEAKESLSNGFTVEKTFENTSGESVIKVGDIIKVSVIFEDKFSENNKWVELSNIAAEDYIPAGFTPINTALKNDSLPPDVSPEDEQYYCETIDGSYPFYADHSEIKKDMFLAFKNTSWSGRFKIVYYLRASYPGTFLMKPARVSLMYAPEIYGQTAPVRINVEE